MLIQTLQNRLVVLVFLMLSISTQLKAQLYQSEIQNQFNNERVKNKWLESDIKEWIITDQYTDNFSRLTHTYIQQKYKDVKVYNALSICVSEGSKILYFKPGIIDHLQNKITNSAPNIEASAALQFAISHLEKIAHNPIQLLRSDVANKQYIFELDEIASSPIKVELVYKAIQNEIRLAWDVSIEMKSEPHWWNIRIDAITGDYIDKNDYTIECQFENTASLDNANEYHEFLDPVPPPPPPPPVVPSYLVYAFPTEAPSFGLASLLSNPSSLLASPFGWHDTDGIIGEEYSITRGNNVYAYDDINNDNLPGYSPDGGLSLTFNYPFTNGASATTNLNAAITNLFYVNNRLHDYLYPLGFTEQAGNFQFNNYGNGGLANDYVRAEGLDGGGSNNANFSTPPDGSSGRMQMYLWTGNTAPCTSLSISSSSYSGTMSIATSTFSPAASVTANVILVNDGAGTLTDACSPIVNSIAGKIALIDRGGTCSFVSKAQMAQNAGAVGVIIANNVSGAAISMTGSPVLSIPSVAISLADGNTLKSALLNGPVNASINTCTVNPIDGCFDNGIISHEYGHGVSNRLTGGPTNTNCLGNAEQGGEGWSDWLALMMTIKPGDVGTTPRGMATFAKSQPTSGAGIRRYPYTTNMSINPQTYASLASSSTVHQIGEIWCDVLWDMSWKLIDQYGMNSNPSNTSAGNNIALRLVLEGMKLQPCNPGYLDARDAILVADAILYGNAHRCLIWQAFAGRGMGYSAVQGSSNVIGDEVAAFDLPPFCLAASQVPIAAFTSSTTTISCGASIQFTDQSTQAFDWLWNFGDSATSILQNPNHTYNTPGTFTVKLKVSNPLGADSITHTVIVTPTFSASISASPTSICSGNVVNLNAVASGSTNISYQVSNLPYAPISGSGTSVSLTDDQMSSALPIGFTFNFFNQNYTNFYICSNGFITFSSGMPAFNVYGEYLPSPSLPNNIIALAWNDLNPSIAGSNINYYTTGIAPNRKLVINYSTTHYLSPSSPFIVQAVLHEGTNLIDIHTTTISNMAAFDPDAFTTQGLENDNGTKGVPVPGRNASLFSASNDAFRFTPYIPYSYNWMPGSLNGSNQTVNPSSTSIYTLSVSDGTSCSSTYTTPVITVNSCPTTLNLTAFIEGYYNGSSTMKPVLFNQGVSTNLNLCDSIRVEIHASTFPYAILASTSAMLHINGTASATVTIAPGSYYIAVKHRNAVPTWSANPIVFTSGTLNYDFSNAPNKAYGSNMKQVEPGVWAFFTGELNIDENVDLLDYLILENSISAFGSGYIAPDLNGDGNADLLDTPLLEDNINNFIFSYHP